MWKEGRKESDDGDERGVQFRRQQTVLRGGGGGGYTVTALAGADRAGRPIGRRGRAKCIDPSFLRPPASFPTPHSLHVVREQQLK